MNWVLDNYYRITVNFIKYDDTVASHTSVSVCACAHMYVFIVHPYQLEINIEIFVDKMTCRSGICFRMFKPQKRDGVGN